MNSQDSIGHLENEIHFQLISASSAASLEAAPSQNGC
jgi:hypothetical protein